MRILLIFIVLLNLLYASWEYFSPTIATDVIPPMADDLKVLELLHEPGSTDLQLPDAGQRDVAAVGDAEIQLSEVEPGSEAGHENDANLVSTVSCYTLGPFRDESIMQQLQESITEYVTNVSVRKRQESEKHRYWVYIPALSGRKQAKLVARKLREKGINDFYIVLSGVAKNGISLGHYREPKHANRRVKRVKKLGFKAEIKVIYREYDIYWLDYEVDTISGEAGFSVDEYLSEGVSQIIRDCNAGSELSD